MTQKELDNIFLKAVNGANTDIFEVLFYYVMNRNIDETVTIKQLQRALVKASRKQEKEINKVLSGQ